MAKNILVINGSPRKNGNTEMLADAFIESARAKGHTVNKFDAGRKKLSGCIACDTCFSTGSACSVKDAFQEVEPMLEAADMIVLATPLYWFNMSAQIKAVIDRLYAYTAKKPLTNIKESMLLVVAETGDEADFNGLIETYKVICRYINWEDKGILTVPKVWAKGDILKTDALERAKELAASI